jgi:hypothetical protein
MNYYGDSILSHDRSMRYRLTREKLLVILNTTEDKIKCLEFTIMPGKILFIPANWWYSIKLNSSETSISSFKYKTYMNNLAISPYLFMYGLQIQNIKRDSNKKKVTFNEGNNETNIFDNKEEDTNINLESSSSSSSSAFSRQDNEISQSELETSSSLETIGSSQID